MTCCNGKCFGMHPSVNLLLQLWRTRYGCIFFHQRSMHNLPHFHGIVGFFVHNLSGKIGRRECATYEWQERILLIGKLQLLLVEQSGIPSIKSEFLHRQKYAMQPIDGNKSQKRLPRLTNHRKIYPIHETRKCTKVLFNK